MDRKSVEWVPSEDEESVDAPHIEFAIDEDWFAVDADQLLIPIVVFSKKDQNGKAVKGIPPNGYKALLKQYGGERLLNDMLMSSQDVGPGSRWRIQRHGPQLTIDPARADDTADD